MFETAELGRTVSKEDYNARAPKLRTELVALQERLRTARFPVLVLINGVDGAGKGDAVNLLLEWLDPRYIRTDALAPPTQEERDRPRYWRFWRALPPRGSLGIFFGNWYTQPIVDRVFKDVDQDGFDHALARIQSFERGLIDDGALIIKLWFHLSKKAQRERFRELQKSKRTRWRVTKQDLENHAYYDRFARVSERALRETSTGAAPWTLVECTDCRHRDLTVAETLVAALRARLDEADKKATVVMKPPASKPPLGDQAPNILDTVDLKRKVSDDEYDEELEELQGMLNRSFQRLKRAGGSVTTVFEGWDAAGKGGTIRRVTGALDARDYQVIPIAAPTDEEKARHYLWRFWRHLPGRGKMTIYDRSWYGRVLVERVEGFAREGEWQRAYSEINEFEEQLVHHGIVVAKLWMHIDLKEQLRRFRERERIEFKRHKITEEDYRNRAKTPAYRLAVHEMVERTSTDIAPWHIVGANDKRAARLDVLAHLCDRIERVL